MSHLKQIKKFTFESAFLLENIMGHCRCFSLQKAQQVVPKNTVLFGQNIHVI